MQKWSEYYLELPDKGTLMAEKEVMLHILITVVQTAIQKLIRKRSWEHTQKSAAAVFMAGQELKIAGHEWGEPRRNTGAAEPKLWPNLI